MASNGNGIHGDSNRARGDGQLRSWKEIASYFGADERTVKRWEVTRGLPVYRVPGEARAPVYAFEAELSAWLRHSREAETPTGPADVRRADRSAATGSATWRRLALGLAVVLAVLAIVAGIGWQRVAREQQSTVDRIADVRQLARSQIATLSDRLEKQPGTVQLRAKLAQEAAATLAKVAALPDAPPALRQEAAEAYRLLARVQSATDRPSLRDRTAARATLDTALGLVANDTSTVGSEIRARILIDAARHAAADGALAKAPVMLAAAAASAPNPPPALREELLLAQSEIAQWQGDYTRAITRAEAVVQANPVQPDAWLRQIRARDLAAEAQYYAGDRNGAVAGYRLALAQAEAGAARFPDQPALQWAVQRQQWNLGSSLAAVNKPMEALPLLKKSLDGWSAMAKADPEDESLRRWISTTRLSYAEALRIAGRTDAAITEHGIELAASRTALLEAPDAIELQRSLVVRLNALADTLGETGRRREACALLDEAAMMMRHMTARGVITGLDGDSLLPNLRESSARLCKTDTTT